MKKILFLFGIITALSSFQSLANQDENYLTCHGCNATEMSDTITSWGLKNISDEYAEMGRPKVIHALDYKSGSVESYLLFKRQRKAWGQWVFNIEKQAIKTPDDIIEKVKEVHLATSELQKASLDITIPPSVISDPWHMVGCGYCVADIQDFYNASLDGQITRFSLALVTVTSNFNVGTAYTPVITLNFANGGRVIFETSLIHNTTELRISKVLAVIDENNNVVPLTREDANGLAIRVLNEARGATINQILYNAWRLGFPTSTIGRVTITECSRLAHAVCF
ncbi:hypothetical protein KIT90_13250 [Vibrio sp. B172a]|uniref:hypothetical protein n=1 Tax=Vibrio sp. B172a TaxID=2835790 RepID=UPI002553A738|nr:hypothetical protein [Vibrio sp. B172a]MDK9782344.1 hypothetical protein [Vibrio sp. B172a]